MNTKAKDEEWPDTWMTVSNYLRWAPMGRVQKKLGLGYSLATRSHDSFLRSTSILNIFLFVLIFFS